MAWFDIIKTPYLWPSRPSMTRLARGTYEFDKIYQGIQGEEHTDYWTGDINTALMYALFGSELEGEPTIRGKPRIKVSVETEENIELEPDPHSTHAIQEEKINYEFLEDSKVKDMISDFIWNMQRVMNKYPNSPSLFIDHKYKGGLMETSGGVWLGNVEEINRLLDHVINMRDLI
jgi:hypothetical protein